MILLPSTGNWSVCGCILYLCYLVLSPEAGVVEWRVSVLVDCVGVCFALDELAFSMKKNLLADWHSELQLKNKKHQLKRILKPSTIKQHRVYLHTLATMSLCPWLAARCKGVSSPLFITLIRAPLMMSMSTTPLLPSLHAQWRGLKPWSSLNHREKQKEEKGRRGEEGQIQNKLKMLTSLLAMHSCARWDRLMHTNWSCIQNQIYKNLGREVKVWCHS